MTDLLELAKRTLAEITHRPDDHNKIDAGLPFDLDAPNLVWARFILNRAEVRKFVVNGALVIGIWSDLDSPDVRVALRVLDADQLVVRYLDGAGIPMRYKLRLVEGEPVPQSVLAGMERHSAAPWRVRDRMLKEMGWCSKRSSWAEWKAATLNRLFEEQGATSQLGRITAAVTI